MRLKLLDGQQGRFTRSPPHLLYISLRSSTKCIFTVFFFLVLFFSSVSLTTSPPPLSKMVFEHWKSDSYCHIFCVFWFVYLYYALAEIKCLFASRFLCVLPLCCYLYSHSAEKERLTLTQIENMPSSYFQPFLSAHECRSLV